MEVLVTNKVNGQMSSKGEKCNVNTKKATHTKIGVTKRQQLQT